jgi:fumarylacetoacetase
MHRAGCFVGLRLPISVLKQPTLNAFISMGRSTTKALRTRLSECFRYDEEPFSMLARKHADAILIKASLVQMLLPLQIGDYTDFYSSRDHAYNVGVMFRDPANALLPNWLHLPVGYHGRSSSIVVSGTPIKRPKGQFLPVGSDQPEFGPSQRLDFELEMAFVIGQRSNMGQQIQVDESDEFIFGMALFNDWSARDIQQWEYVPLGPFLGKNFGSTISPWIVTLDALQPFRIEGLEQMPTPLPYLQQKGPQYYDINLEVWLQPRNSEADCISKSNFKHMYWSMAQQLAHHTVNGCNVNVGDLMASGTISGPTPGSYGSMLELAWKGTKPITLSNGSTRTFIQDGDTLTLHGYCQHENGIRIGFGECSGSVVAADL